MLLAGDIGGTKTALALYVDAQSLTSPIAEATFASAQYSGLEAIVREFLKMHPHPVSVASLGVAGPIIGNEAQVTNLHWRVNTTELASQLDTASVYLLNDLAAIANALAVLQPEDLYTLNAGKPVAGGSMAVIAPGTGLGEAFLVWDGTRYCAYPSEGGHTDFAPTNDWEAGLWRHLHSTLGFAHISYEAVCSGLGIPNIYAYVKATGVAEEPEWLATALAATRDHTPVIVNAALDTTRPCPICATTLDTFISILGAEAGNLALKSLATGGLYLGGGIPLRILPQLSGERFMHAFRSKGRFAKILNAIPVHVIRNPKAALMGAANYGFAQLG
ncbi:MAG: glucokinase [Caldilineaceae bacterium]